MPFLPYARYASPLVAALLLCAVAQSALAANPLEEVLAFGRPLADVRLRFENVNQENKTKEASAATLRARLGYQTKEFLGLSALAEFDLVQHFGASHYDDTIGSGLSAYAVIADPDMATLNRLQLAYAARIFSDTEGMQDLHAVLGRQRFVLGDGRYIGNADWRQHEQTFDAVSMTETLIPAVTLTYAYVDRVNRIFGPASRAGHFDSDSHLFHLAFTGLAPSLRVEGFAYFIDLKQAPQSSAQTVGLRAEERVDLGAGVALRMNATYANQRPYGGNLGTFDLTNYLAEGGLAYHGWTGLIGYEVLEGDGHAAFQTPLANLHAFQGWAEIFLVKPPDGLKDLYLKGAYNFDAVPFLARLTPSFAYHSFSAEHVTADYGHEWDAQMEAQVDAHLTLDGTLAVHTPGGPFPAKTVFWLYATYRL